MRLLVNEDERSLDMAEVANDLSSGGMYLPLRNWIVFGT